MMVKKFSGFLRLPQVSSHIHMPIVLEYDALSLQEYALKAPSWGCAPFLVYHTMAGQRGRFW